MQAAREASMVMGKQEISAGVCGAAKSLVRGFIPDGLISAGRRILTIAFALLILGVLTWAYVAGIQLVADQYRIMAFGLYGVFLAAHLVIQSFFASLEHRRMRRESLACSLCTRS